MKMSNISLIRAQPNRGRKRELNEYDPFLNIKKSRPEREFIQRPVEIRFKKRNLITVVDELCVRVDNNDRQLTNILLRELETEHVRQLDRTEIIESCTKLLKSCVDSKIDTVSQKLLRTCTTLMKIASRDQWIQFLKMISEEATAESLFTKNVLDARILEIFTYAIDQDLIYVPRISERIILCARRSVNQADICTTQTRTNAIEFLVSLTLREHRGFYQLKDCEEMLCRLTKDRDFRVRSSATKGILRLCSHSFSLSLITYSEVKLLLRDTDSNIRIMSLEILLYFANQKPIQFIDEYANLSISDDAFSAVCDAMNDIEVSVRVNAARKLGEFEDVSDDLIFQTLDKKMMRSNKASEVVKVEKSLFAMSNKSNGPNAKRWRFLKKQPVNEANTQGGWSRGKELNAACPENDENEEDKVEDDSIIPHGACGAFVSALEDEFMDVRKAAVYSLGKLASDRPSFANSALEYLADMFNDEIAEVRLDAIHALTPLIVHGQMNIDELNVIVKCLDDGMPDSRQAMRELLQRAQFTNVNCIELLVKALIACLKRFPKDKEHIYACMGSIGRNHSVHVQSIMRNLLGLHLIFHTKEQSIEDSNYVAKLIMVLNAASKQPAMVYVMPEFVHRHYRYLRSSSPHLIHPIKILDEQQNGKLRKPLADNSSKAEEIVMNTYARLCDSQNSKQLAERNENRETILRDATAISSYNENVSGATRLICCLGEIAIAVDTTSEIVLLGGEMGNIRSSISQHLDGMQYVFSHFSGASSQIECYLIECHVYLAFLDLLVLILQGSISQNEIISTAHSIIGYAKDRMNRIEVINESLDKFIENCCKLFPISASGNEVKKVITSATIGGLLESSLPKLPKKFPSIKFVHLKYAQITAPNKDAALENTMRFYSNMPHGVTLEASLFNLEEDDDYRIRVKVTYPDGKCDIMKPRDRDFRMIGNRLLLSTQVKITSSTSWTDSAEIDVSLGLLSDCNTFVTLSDSSSKFSRANVRIKIHPVAR